MGRIRIEALEPAEGICTYTFDVDVSSKDEFTRLVTNAAAGGYAVWVKDKGCWRWLSPYYIVAIEWDRT